ncbi:glycoside hydrolase family 95 protein [Prolixibacteraceae bacterium JC049]|nr:glycoside hydrolase family 95 protein [Prolixibacteraceae bacterium JC049]
MIYFRITAFIGLCFLLLSCEKKAVQTTSEQLWYKQPASNWFQALPVGNGRLGAMVFGGVTNEHLQLNEESLWAGCPENPYPENVQKHYKKFQNLNLEGKYDQAFDYAMKHLAVNPTSIRSYEPLGDLLLNFNHGKAEHYKRSLLLENGNATVEYTVGGKRFKRETFVSEDPDVIVYRFESIDNEPVDCEVRYSRVKDIKIYTSENTIWVDGQVFDDPEARDDNRGGSGKTGKHMKFGSLVKVKLDNGKCSHTPTALKLENTKAFTVFVGGATTYQLAKLNYDNSINLKTQLAAQLAKAEKLSYKEIRAKQFAKHAAVYNRVNLKLTDNQLDSIPTDERILRVKEGKNDPLLVETLFQYGRYLLMGSSGGKAQLPANLQGLWNKDMWAAWESDYHMNINLQMNYWPAQVCNLEETVEPLTNFVELMAERGQETAQKYIGSDGWIVHHATNIFGRTVPNGSTKPSQVANGYSYAFSGPWMCLTLWRQFEFTQDKEYLKNKAYPIMKGAAQFVIDFLRENDKGQLVTAPSYSPENGYWDPKSKKYLKTTVAATMDIQIIKELFNACIESEKVLGKSDLTPKLKEVLTKLPPIKIGANGTIQEWIEDYKEQDPGHRHISHLFGLYPCSQINASTPKMYEAARKTLERRLSSGGGQTGWSRAWVVNFYARFNEGDKCLENVNQLLANQVDINLFDLHPPHIFQIDGNLGITAGIAEMLIQSNEPGKIKLLPALPSVWKKGSVSGLKARGNYEVSMNWEQGQLKNTTIKALVGGNIQLIYNDKVMNLQLQIGEEKQIDASQL